MKFLLWPVSTLHKEKVTFFEVTFAIVIMFLTGFSLGGALSWFAIIHPKDLWLPLGIMSGFIMSVIGLLMYLSNKLDRPYFINAIMPITLVLVFATVALITN